MGLPTFVTVFWPEQCHKSGKGVFGEAGDSGVYSFKLKVVDGNPFIKPQVHGSSSVHVSKGRQAREYSLAPSL